MTREERNTKLKHLITCLKCEKSGKVCDDNCPVQYEAGNMGEIIENLEAISKALEQEPCGDAISREATLEPYNGLNDEDMIIVWLIRKNIEQQPSVNPQPSKDCVDRHSVELLTYRYLKEATDNHVAFYEELLDLPSVTPQPKTGHWIKYDNEYFPLERWTSLTHSIRECSVCHAKIADFVGEMKYCPNCGAKMQEVEE